jgi:beta-glucanase (GH16 family)
MSNSYLSCFTYLTAVILISLFLITANSFAVPAGDFDRDGYVGFKDLSFLCLHWLEPNEPNCPADIDGDCNVDLFDYAILAQNWLKLECSAFTATASSQESGLYAPYNAIDGSMSTRWSSSFANNQWLKIDMGQIRDVNGVTIYWEAAYASTYNVQISTDDSTWATVYTTNSGNGGTDVISFTLQPAQYIKINCITRATVYGSSIWEVIVNTDDECTNQPPTGEDWTLVWSDEFNGTSVDTTVWNYEIGGSGWGNSELQYYTSRLDNSYIENGNLVIQAKNESYGDRYYTSARMTTLGKKSFTYGRFEARIKLPPGGTGMWPAFWMMPEDWATHGWPACGEIDIMESINYLTTIYGTIHYADGGGHQSNGGNYTPAISPTNDYHIYAIEWKNGIIRWYFDDINYYTSTTWSTDYAPFPAPFDKPFFFILNIAVGGYWPGCTSPSCITATFPQKMYIDYLRVYQEIP